MGTPVEYAMGGDDEPSVYDNPTIFSIEDVEIDVPESATLGDSQDARVGHGVADLNIGTSSLDGVFTEITYGRYQDEPACRIRMRFTVRSDASFRLKGATLVCTVASVATEKLDTSSADIVRPDVLKVAPEELSDDNPTEVGVTAGWSLSPNASIPNGASFNVGSINRQMLYSRTYGWHLSSHITSSDGHRATTRDTAIWRFSANVMQRNSRKHVFDCEMLIRHVGTPFYATFQLDASLGFGVQVRTIGKQKRIQTRRRFSPFETAISFS